jgi:hypothetical protein
MGFARHQTFYLRSGWLTKAIFALEDRPRLFSQKDAPIELGMGKNMVNSLRFWIKATGLAQQKKPVREGMELTNFGSLVKKYDPFLELDLTWWLIHFNIIRDEDEATAWYFLFNKYPRNEFEQISFIEALARYSDNAVAQSSYKKDYDCILATYLDANKKETPEDNIICPLSRFALLSQAGDTMIRKTSSNKMIPLEVIFYVIKESVNTRTNISNLLENPNNIGKVFNLSLDEIYRYLDLLDEKGWLGFSRTAGLDSIILKRDVENNLNLIKEAYQLHSQEVEV